MGATASRGGRAGIAVRPIAPGDASWVREFATRTTGSLRVVSRGVLHHPDRLPGFIASLDGVPSALLTWRADADGMEVVTLYADPTGAGLGSALLDAALEEARARGARRLWLVTTNDNEPAIRFYERRGMRLAAVHEDALAVSRALKPEIPLFGHGGRPIRDELEFELVPATLREVGAGGASAAIDVLEEAFAGDAWFAYCFQAEVGGFERRVRAYLELGHRWHVAQGHPVQGASARGTLAGVLYAALPEPRRPAPLEELEDALAAACGAEAARRFSNYNRSVGAALPRGRLHTLALTGVRPAWRGRGIGGQLVRWLSALADTDGGSDGVVLDTASDRNVRFYERAGYRVHAEVAVGPLRQRVLWRPGRDTLGREGP